jgi:hypothetical protein
MEEKPFEREFECRKNVNTLIAEEVVRNLSFRTKPNRSNDD